MPTIDPEDSQPQQERTFEFRGQPLAPYTFKHQAALYRLRENCVLPAFEEYPYLVYLLLTRKKAEEADALRAPQAIAKFRIEAGDWAERESLRDGTGWDELQKLAESILTPVKKAEDIVPAPVAGTVRRPGNE